MPTTATVREVVSRGSAKSVAWALANGESGDPVEFGDFPDRSVQIGGTFGAGGTVVIKGSNDGVNYIVLTDPQGNPLSFTAEGIEAISEVTEFLRPAVTAGDGTTAITITAFMRGDF